MRVPVIILVLALGIALSVPACSRGSKPPNLLILMVDTLRADHLGCYGHARDTSPELDRFAEGSVLFAAHYAQASRTGPSVASLFTSLHARTHGVVNPLNQWDGIGVLEESNSTLAEALARNGFRCGAVVANPNVYPQFGFSQGFDTYRTVHIHMDAAQINERALEWLDGKHESPFFLYLHYMDPHSPYGAPPPLDTRFVDPDYAGPFTGEHIELDEILSGKRTANAADREHLLALYDQDIFLWDQAFGRLIQALEARGLLENTIVVVVSDHGEEFLEHAGVLHGYTLYEEQLRVPLILRAPGLSSGRVAAMTRNIDIMPTLLDQLEIPETEGLQGKSLVPLIENGRKEDRYVFSEAGIRAVKTVKMRALQEGGWKYIETLFPPDIPPQLFDLTEDPGEQEDLFQEQPEQAETMRKKMQALLEKIPEGESRSATLDREGLEQLKKLGYVGEKN
ncbi:MAG: sulfatase family protein [Planctomycetota bacterium]